jgi:hypothetical protein
MARGWESKSVEAQQEEVAARNGSGKSRLTREEASRLREIESLRLSLQNVLQQIARTSDPRHRAMLEMAKMDLEGKMQGLETRGEFGR